MSAWPRVEQINRLLKFVAATVILWLCLGATGALGQASAGLSAEDPAPILTAQLADPGQPMRGTVLSPRAARHYRRALHEVHCGKASRAEKDALQAVLLQPNFAEGYALAATASLMQRNFAIALSQAETAARLSPGDSRAWVLAATADNYMGRYAEAIAALKRVSEAEGWPWQVDYQWARAEAGLGQGAAVLDHANRAAASAPPEFAPLHLIRASALLDARQYSASADELQTYLRLAGARDAQQSGLRSELRQIRRLALEQGAPVQVPAEANALAN